MKRLLVLLLTLALSVSFASCGGDTENGADSDGNTAVEDNNTADNTADNAADDAENKDNSADKDNDQKIERSIDAVADYLNLKKGDETLYNMIGAKAGREYNGGNIELYEFDKDSAEYKNIIDGKGSVEAAAHNDGIVMVVTKEQDKDLIQKFKDIKFK